MEHTLKTKIENEAWNKLKIITVGPRKQLTKN